jgi:hypothetical protein
MGTVKWDELLEPFRFQHVFPDQSPRQLITGASPNPDAPNIWLCRLPFILQCTRSVNQLICAFENFFQALGFEGLREVVQSINLNRELDFEYNPLLDREQALYLTALYDFLLREHAIGIATPILRLLHISFQEAGQLKLLCDIIIDIIDPPLSSFMLYDAGGDQSDIETTYAD